MHDRQPPNPDCIGTVAAVRGSVVDVRSQSHLPLLYHRLVTQDSRATTLEVVNHLAADLTRCIAMTPTQGLSGFGCSISAAL